MNGRLNAAISTDIDTLSSIYKGKGCNTSGYTFADLHSGLENFLKFLDSYKIKATFFMVGNDFRYEKNHNSIKAVSLEGHEIANHTLSHVQGFRYLSAEDQKNEILGMENLCKDITGKKPIGFRAPGWNIGDNTISILKELDYLYDSSIYPTFMIPLLKFLHWRAMSDASKEDRTTMGHIKYMFAPALPYRTGLNSFLEKNGNGIIEFPVTVTPIIRLPFFATFLTATGIEFFKILYRLIKLFKYPIQFQFHLSDFVDYSSYGLVNQMPSGKGLYIPQALSVSYSQKKETFEKIIDIISEDYSFNTLSEWAEIVGGYDDK